MISELINRDGQDYLKFFPHGYNHPLTLPVITKGSRDKHEGAVWSWNGDLEKPTLKPSIKTTHGITKEITHYWLNDGICKYLGDCTDGNANKELPLKAMTKKDMDY